MPRTHLSARLVAVAALTALVAAGLTGTATARSAGDRELIDAATRGAPFSPDGDGVRDRARIGFELGRAARVTATVRDADGERVVRGPVRLGRLAAGRHAWTWNGRTESGRITGDGDYRVVLTARTATRSDSTRVWVAVDTARPEGELVSSRPTVHPRATVVDDRVRLTWVVEGWNPFEEEQFPEEDAPALTRVAISRAGGDVVWRREVRRTYTPSFVWSARRDGRALPAGDYVARVTVRDAAGNRRQVRQDLTVSHDQLVEAVWSRTVSAGEASSYVPYFGGCNGCGEVCSPVPSERFAGGLSFRPCPDGEGWSTTEWYAADVPFVEAPVDSYRITTTGGPTDGEGTSTTTDEWRTPDLTGDPYLPDQARPITWGFGIDPDEESYDVDTFTIEYRHYVPAD